MINPEEEIDLPPELEVEHKSLQEHVFEALGHASVCWNPRPSGEFDSREATKAGETLMRHINTDLPHACGIVFKALREDKEYYDAWQASIAMHFHDEFSKMIRDGEIDVKFKSTFTFHDCCNNAAKNFLNLLIKPIDNE